MAQQYTLVIGTKNLSSWSLRPWLALRATAAPFAETLIALRQSDTAAEILKHSPTGKVPVLKIDDGDGAPYTVFESLAICETLADRHPECGLWPDDPRARAEARSSSAVMHCGFAALRSTLPMDFARRLPTPALDATVKEQITEVIGYWERALSRYGDKNGFLFGRFSIADCMYAPVVSRFLTYGIDLPHTVKPYAEHIMAQQAMRDWGEAAQHEVDKGLG
jgi:glutathione S-transferase